MKMSNEVDPKKLTINDPIAPDTLKRLGALQQARLQIAEQLLDMELEKIKLVVGSRQLDDEKQRVFEKELTDRGLPPNAPVEVDAKTGMIAMVQQQGQQPAAHS
jgi:hypothetical protein